MDFDDLDRQKLTSRNDLTVSQNIELRNLLNDCNRLACSGDFNQWRWKLDAIQRELNYDMEDQDKNKKNYDKFQTKLENIEDKIGKTKNKLELYKLLQEKEKILRTIQEKAGKGTKRVFDDDDDD